MQREKTYNYVYLLQWDVFFYIGCRSSVNPPDKDKYLGSGVAIRERWFEEDGPPKKIILGTFDTRQKATLEEARYIQIFFTHKLCMNLKFSKKNHILPNERPNIESLDKVQSLFREAERRYLDSFPHEAGTMSRNPLWREGVGVESNS